MRPSSTRTARVVESAYMKWAKFTSHSRLDLATSAVRRLPARVLRWCRLSDVPR